MENITRQMEAIIERDIWDKTENLRYRLGSSVLQIFKVNFRTNMARRLTTRLIRDIEINITARQNSRWKI